MKKPRTKTIHYLEDPEIIQQRHEVIERCLDMLLAQFIDMDVKERIATISAVPRVILALEKVKESNYGYPNAGSAVRQYEAAFSRDASRQRDELTRSTAKLSDFSKDDDELEY